MARMMQNATKIAAASRSVMARTIVNIFGPFRLEQ
jgi:hypothetical protein